MDEAHNLEDSATSAVTEEVGAEHVGMLCDAIWNQRKRSGFLARVTAVTDAQLDDEPVLRVGEAVDSVRAAVERLTDPLIDYVRDRTGLTRQEAAQYGTSHRIRRGEALRQSAYQPVVTAGRALRDALRDTADAIDDIPMPQERQGRYSLQALEEQQALLGREARQMAKLADAILWASDEPQLLDDDIDHDYGHLVQWINIAEISFESTTGSPGPSTNSDTARPPGRQWHESPVNPGHTNSSTAKPMPGRWVWVLRRAPLSVAGLLSDIWNRSHSSVLTSATLSTGVGDDFSYLVGRLGLGDPETKLIPSPFTDLDERHLVLLTDYLPAPRGQLIDRFTEFEAAEIPRLCVASGGGAMALMTARARLKYVRDHARGHLTPLGMRLLAQGDDSPGALVDEMKSDADACLLGLRSFWEGVDIPGEALRLLIVEKVPFDSMGDPIVSARMALLELQGKDPFTEYMVPRAAIALAQARDGSSATNPTSE